MISIAINLSSMCAKAQQAFLKEQTMTYNRPFSETTNKTLYWDISQVSNSDNQIYIVCSTYPFELDGEWRTPWWLVEVNDGWELRISGEYSQTPAESHREDGEFDDEVW